MRDSPTNHEIIPETSTPVPQLTPQVLLSSFPATHIQFPYGMISPNMINPAAFQPFVTTSSNLSISQPKPASPTSSPGACTKKKQTSRQRKRKKKSPSPTRNCTNWRTDFNSQGRSTLGVVVDWLTKADGELFNLDKWTTQGGKTNKTAVAQEVNDYLAVNGFPNIPTKNVETQAKDFRDGTGQGVKREQMEKALGKKEANGYATDNEEWQKLLDEVETNFEKLVKKHCPFFDDLYPVFMAQKATTPDAVQDSNAEADKGLLLPQSKQIRPSSFEDIQAEELRADNLEVLSNHNITIVGQSPDPDAEDINSTQEDSIEQALSKIKSPVFGSPPTSSQLEKSTSVLRALQSRADLTSGMSPDKGRRKSSAPSSSAQLKNKFVKRASSTSSRPGSSNSGVGTLFQDHLPSRDKRIEAKKKESEKWEVQRDYMAAERLARQMEINTNNRLVNVLATSLAPPGSTSSNGNNQDLEELKISREKLELEQMHMELESRKKMASFEEVTRRTQLYKQFMETFNMSFEEAKRNVDAEFTARMG
ncbi:hypothetical protein DFH28DRAFT_1155813 [Melampsora americana]|nr:hypothetical protein DFH28DRAFT_1155813 [Melampsora americana]